MLPAGQLSCLALSGSRLKLRKSLSCLDWQDVVQTLCNEEHLKPETQLNVKFGSSGDRYGKSNIYTAKHG